MGAIAGVRPHQRETAREELIAEVAAMRRLMAPRAPIEGGMAVAYDASIALAHGGSRGPAGESVLQPLVDESGTLWLVADGEPSNAAALRLELVAAGHEFRSACGAEVIVHLYEQGGIGALERLAGSFAFALWDRERQELLLGRDRFGSRPLYVSERGGVVAFASEVRALRQGSAPDPAGLAAFLTLGYLPEPVTVMRDVRAVPAGTIVRVRDGRMHEERFWEEAAALPSGDRATDDAHLGWLLRESVESAIAGEDAVGVLADDGLASAALLALVRPLLGRGLRTHAFRFVAAEDEPAAPRARRRSRDAGRAVAEWFGADHHQHLVTPRMLEDAISSTADVDQPSIGAPLAQLGAAAMNAAGERVWLSSLASPGLLGPSPRGVVSWLWWAGQHASTRMLVRTGLRALARQRPFGHAAQLAGSLDHRDSVAAAYLARGCVLAPTALATVLRPEVLEDAGSAFDAVAHLDAQVAHAPGPPCVLPPRSAQAALGRALAAIELGGPVISGALRDAERMATSQGLAMRTPFLDHRLFEWVTTGAAGDDSAPLLRVVGSAMPRVTAQRGARPEPPLDAWMRGPLRPAIEARVFADDPEGLFSPRGLDRLWSAFLAGHTEWRGVWALALARGWITAQRGCGAARRFDQPLGRVAA